MRGTVNALGDTGVEVVARMAATTPALKTLNLHSASVSLPLFVFVCLSLLRVPVSLCFCVLAHVRSFDIVGGYGLSVAYRCSCGARLPHGRGRGEVCGVVVGQEPTPAEVVDWQ